MKSYRFKKIDAFTGSHSSGNPAGCIYLQNTGDITDGEMLEIARQLKGYVSEVAFLFPEGDSYFLRYFSSEREVDFCGHATIAALHDVFSRNSTLHDLDSITIRVGNSHLTVQNELKSSSSVFVAAPEPRFHPMNIPFDDIGRALGISSADIDSKYRIALVNSGLNSLLVPMRLSSALTDVLPDFEVLNNFCVKSDIDIVVLFSDDRILPGSNYRTRVFATRFGYLEDPATGSGNAAFGCMLLKEGFWKGNELTIEQGRSYKAPNIVKLRADLTGTQPRVLFGGSATVRVDGQYLLY
jgi:PhzF family phenazine biosynthesis protein